MPDLGTAHVQIVSSARGIVSDIRRELGDPLIKAGKSAGDETAKKFGSSFTAGIGRFAKVGAAAFAATFVGALAVAKDSIGAASNLNEAVSKTKAVFGDSAGAVVDWSKGSAKAFGTSQRAALEAAGTYGNLFKAFGVDAGDAEKMSKAFVELSADMASFNNTSIEDAQDALRSALSGETEPMKRYGSVLSDVRLKQKAVALGLIKSTKDALTPAAKAQAAYALIMEDTIIQQGDFARTSDGLANTQRRLKAQWENASASIGRVLLPIATRFVSWLADTAIPKISELAKTWVPRLQAAFRAIAGFIRRAFPIVASIVRKVIDVARRIVSGVVSVFSPLVGWIRDHWGQISEVTRSAWTIISTVVRVAVGAIAAVVYGVVKVVQLVWRNFGQQIVAFTRGAWQVVAGVIGTVMGVIRGIINAVAALIRGDWLGFLGYLAQIGRAVWTGIVAIVGGAARQVAAVVSAAWRVISAVTGPVWRGIAAVVGGAWNLIRSIATTAAGAVRAAANFMNRIGFGPLVAAIGAVAGALLKVIALAAAAASALSKLDPASIAPKVGLGGLNASIDLSKKGRASGGPVRAGEAYVVGEKRPELFVPNRSGRIVPRVPAGFGSGGHVTVQVNAPVYGVNDLQSAIATGVRDGFRRLTAQRRFAL